MVDSNRDIGQVFRHLHEREGVFVIPNPWDVGSARILAGMGFEALATTSAGMAFALGLREGTVSEADTLDHCRTIVKATNLPVSADLEKGFGDSPRAVADCIGHAAGIGLAGCSIEDHRGNSKAPIYEFELAVERITAAAEAAQALPKDFVLTARTENFLWGRPDLDDSIRRLQAFSEAGADVLYAPGLGDIENIRTLCAEVDKPVNVVMGLPGKRYSVDELALAGVKRISLGAASARAAYGTLVSAANEINQQGSFTFADDIIGFAELDAFFEPVEID